MANESHTPRSQEEAEELLKFYSEDGNFNSDVWEHDSLGFFTGKRAREYMKKWEGM